MSTERRSRLIKIAFGVVLLVVAVIPGLYGLVLILAAITGSTDTANSELLEQGLPILIPALALAWFGVVLLRSR